MAWGLPVRFVGVDSHQACDLVYADKVALTRVPSCPVLWFDEGLFRPETICGVRDWNGRAIWARSGARDEIADLIGSIYRLLLLLDEAQVSPEARDKRGVFLNDAPPPDRQSAADLPLVEGQADALLEIVLAHRPELTQRRLPRWPQRKQYAVVITHDTDAVSPGAAAEIASQGDASAQPQEAFVPP